MTTTKKDSESYDPVSLYYWLRFKNHCHECTPTEFQRLFEAIMKKGKNDFIPVRPYGKYGDRKSDGIAVKSGTFYQVYSPDELKLGKSVKKIDQDLEGARAEWGSHLKRWVFVYNVRRGLAPDIPKILMDKKESHPDIEIDYLSTDALWNIFKALSRQDQADILGPPPRARGSISSNIKSYDHMRKELKGSRCVIVQDIMTPIDMAKVLEALKPEEVYGAPIIVRPSLGRPPWENEALWQRNVVDEAIVESENILPRYAVFSFAPIPLAIHLGFLLSNRLDVQCFQYDRDRHSWKWPGRRGRIRDDLVVKGISSSVRHDSEEVIIRISLTASIDPEDTYQAIRQSATEYSIQSMEHGASWLRSPEQLLYLRMSLRRVLDNIRSCAPGCKRLHIFYSGPCGGAVCVGQEINPRMSPAVYLYEYSYQRKARYEKALVLRNKPYRRGENRHN